jgi:hypothetical protein
MNSCKASFNFFKTPCTAVDSAGVINRTGADLNADRLPVFIQVC